MSPMPPLRANVRGRAALVRQLERLERMLANRDDGVPTLERLRADPTGLMTRAGMVPDAWQEQVLRTPADRMLLLCSRQAGKSSVAAALAFLQPNSPESLMSLNLHQAGKRFSLYSMP